MLASAGALFLAAPLRWRAALPVAENAAPPARAVSVGSAAVTDSALADAEELTVNGDPFRLSNSPPDVRYDPALENLGQGAR